MVKRRTFFSFHFKNDAWRAGQVRNMGVVEGNAPVSDNDWEEVKKKGDNAIEDWIKDQLKNRSCTVVLVGDNVMMYTNSNNRVLYTRKGSLQTVPRALLYIVYGQIGDFLNING